MKIINHSALPNDLAERTVRECVLTYETLYGGPSCKVEFILCDSEDALVKERIRIQGRDELHGQKFYNGSFLPPEEKTDTLIIVVVAENKVIQGARQFFKEEDNGSFRDTGLSKPELERRGVKLMAFFSFAENLLHEYSHLCSFDALMRKTDWEEPRIIGYSWDYHLHDEFIARYRGTMAALKMAEPFMETDLLYSLWMMHWNGVEKGFREEREAITRELERVRKGNIDSIHAFMKEEGMSEEEMADELECELGHPLELRGNFYPNGVPKMTDIEAAEFVCIDEAARIAIPLIYALKNRAATYQGAQIFGLAHAYYDFLSEKTGAGDPELLLNQDALSLPEVYGIPYFEYVGDKADGLPPAKLGMKKVNRTLKGITELFIRLLESKKNKHERI